MHCGIQAFCKDTDSMKLSLFCDLIKTLASYRVTKEACKIREVTARGVHFEEKKNPC